MVMATEMEVCITPKCTEELRAQHSPGKVDAGVLRPGTGVSVSLDSASSFLERGSYWLLSPPRLPCLATLLM